MGGTPHRMIETEKDGEREIEEDFRMHEMFQGITGRSPCISQFFFLLKYSKTQKPTGIDMYLYDIVLDFLFFFSANHL